MEIFAVALILGLIPAVIAERKGRNGVAWWIYGSALFLFALPHALFLKPSQENIDKRKLLEGMKKCPHCAEIIRGEAKVCRFCGRNM